MKIPNLDKRYELVFSFKEASLAEVLESEERRREERAFRLPNLDKKYKEPLQISPMSMRDVLAVVGVALDEEVWRLAQACRDVWTCYRALAEAKVAGRYDEYAALVERVMAGLL